MTGNNISMDHILRHSYWKWYNVFTHKNGKIKKSSGLKYNVLISIESQNTYSFIAGSVLSITWGHMSCIIYHFLKYIHFEREGGSLRMSVIKAGRRGQEERERDNP